MPEMSLEPYSTASLLFGNMLDTNCIFFEVYDSALRVGSIVLSATGGDLA